MAYLRSLLIALVATVLVSTTARAAEVPPPDNPDHWVCPDAEIFGKNLISGVCWSCLFPVRIMGVSTGFGSNHFPSDAVSDKGCMCFDEAGVPEFGWMMGMWAPARLVEVVRSPYCSPTLGGKRIKSEVRLTGKSKADANDGEDPLSFYQYHYYSFPLYLILDLLVSTDCNRDGYLDLDLMYLSEVDPTWNDDELSFLMNPEVAVFANPIAQAACVADCAASSAGNGISSMYWCAGCWGGLYPFSGHINRSANPVRDSSLLATRAVAALHRRGLAHKTYGDDAKCGGFIAPFIPKDQYRMSMLYPVAEANSTVSTPSDTGEPPPPPPAEGEPGSAMYSQGCCHEIGTSTMLWGEWRNIPQIGEDFVYMLWRYSDCCMRSK